MVHSILLAVRQIKADVAKHLEPETVERICRELDYRWRERILGPVATVHAFLLQVLHGNTACDHVPHLMGQRFTGEAYAQARARLPLELFERLLAAVCHTLKACCDESARWCGHRVWILDGSSCSMPDTPELQAAFGQPGRQAAGCGFPVAHLLTLFHAGTGLLQKVLVAPLRTHDVAGVQPMHDELEAGDVVVADRGFCSYAHLALLARARLHAVLRVHQRTLVNFRIGRMHTPPAGPYRKLRRLPRSEWIKWLGVRDQWVKYFKPKQRPGWLSVEDFASLPASMIVRELRYRIRRRGYRTRQVTLVTTLLDVERYPLEELAQLYADRWQIETNLRHLKQTLHLDVLRTKTVAGVHKELRMIALVYNLVRLVMLKSAAQQRVPIERISFIDALRWLTQAGGGPDLDQLALVPHRPDRIEPRAIKRRPNQYHLLNRPRAQLRKALLSQRHAP
jgi:IS5 family transposase